MDLSLFSFLGDFTWTVVTFIVALSIIVAVHEYGHYIVGRWSGIRSDVFSVGFGKVLFSRVDKRGTRWQIAALPFGGYVKFAGDANAASVGGEEGVVQARDTMHGAPLWARSATVAAGPIFNFILSILVFAAVVLATGQASDEARVGPLKPMPSDMVLLQQGDEIKAVEGVEVADLGEVLTWARTAEPSSTVTYSIVRDGVAQDVEAAFPMLAVVSGVQPRSAAIDAGLEVGDVIRAIDGTSISAFEELRTAVGESDGQPLALSVWRAGDMIDVTLEPRRRDLPLPEGGFETRWLIGINGGLFFEPEIQSAGLWEAVSYGANQTWMIITKSLSALWHIITGQISTCNLSGPVGMAQVAGDSASQGMSQFIWFIAVLSTAVGFLNLFPIPVLDGGHLVFHAYEAIAGRKPPEKILRVMMMVGVALVLSLMVFGLSQDFFCE